MIFIFYGMVFNNLILIYFFLNVFFNFLSDERNDYFSIIHFFQPLSINYTSLQIQRSMPYFGTISVFDSIIHMHCILSSFQTITTKPNVRVYKREQHIFFSYLQFAYWPSFFFFAELKIVTVFGNSIIVFTFFKFIHFSLHVCFWRLNDTLSTESIPFFFSLFPEFHSITSNKKNKWRATTKRMICWLLYIHPPKLHAFCNGFYCCFNMTIGNFSRII